MNRRGSSIFEVLVALAIMAIATVSAFSVFAATAGTQADLGVQAAAETSLAGLDAALSRYVSADLSTPADGPQGSWRLPGDGCAYALDQGCLHDATASFLDPLVAQRHPGARLTYTVEPDPGADALRVTMKVEWN